ncbi:MerR family transcriptional regulator [Arsenicicoccus bolidensis]|uniref:MerR family transcriptional regulator n=1 Tax=Arsenicicoccus bolidensis TaxID=229480 RepID=UPI00040CC574|nr:MerR family transcriptional regulator [Arsenicicoccus bolidensis]
MLISPVSGPVPDRPLHIGDVADLTGLSLRSIRHYEDLGLVTPRGRTNGGFRIYGAEAVERLRLVMDLKIIGLPLERIRPIVDACLALENGEGTDDDVATVAECRSDVTTALAEIEQRLSAAKHLGQRLGQATARANA